MYLAELISQFLRDMRARKLRTLLAMFGIAWGTVAVVLLLAIGGAFHAASSKAMHGMGESIVIIWPSRTTKPFEGLQPGRLVQMKSSDVIEMGQALPQILRASPELTHGEGTLTNGDHRVKASVAGVVPEYELMRNMIPVLGGRFLNSPDMAERRRVVFLGDTLAKKLFPQEEAVGRTVLVDGRPFTVIGVLQKKIQSSSYSGPDADRAFIPYTTFIAIWGDWNVDNVLVQPNPPRDSEGMKKAIYTYLGQKYRFDPGDEGALGMWDTVERDRFTDWFFWGLQAFLGLAGALTLGAGGIGVANVMFLIIRERTREIGVRMAVGAQEWHIMGQVMLEALLIVGLGGSAGFLFSALVIWVLQVAPLPEWLGNPELSPLAALSTLGVLSLVGVLAGYFPARRAARMDPVRALGF
ncbi:MAG: ABC transporter permease [Candidatus Handelsmanbacteria bacterium]|nr:ABC transporter permease [Candidatus Handelsmanbacteria bacterium]